MAERGDRIGKLESRWTEVDGIKMHVRTSVEPVSPDAPIVVLVHGVGVSSRNLLPTAVRLAPYYQVYAPDLPGFGRSAKFTKVLRIPELADWLAAWMKVMKLRRPVVIANSVGCQTVAHLAMHYPEHVGQLVLIGPTTDPQARTFLQQVQRWLAGSSGESFRLTLSNLRDYWDCGIKRLVVTFQHSLEDRIEDNLPYIQAPTMVVRGSRDVIVPHEWAEEIIHLLPCGRLYVVPDAMHTVNFQAPNKLLHIVRPLIDTGQLPPSQEQAS